ncbi:MULTISPECIES: Hpt domain-containing protein [Gammaproteobacteria]|uniref:Hpt domain-containing protein n=1 Tax=Gammaproteobacteria TaxID=1236 RepID=UPI000DCF96E0|nr:MULTISPECIES: Hpt domain-containing protein [Gammaproteobacteria]RTE86243.1 histidine kinase [Aliidiomarina sp. B3213]TCZ91594.1 histidine kinase [Lysobacter sp. N42]
MNNLDTHLIEQYLTILGKEGIQDSYKSFVVVMPEYIEELDTCKDAKDSGGLRKQAHKIKGACRSLGFSRLAEHMEYLEKEAWSWPEADQVMQKWDSNYKEDTEALASWLEGKR